MSNGSHGVMYAVAAFVAALLVTAGLYLHSFKHDFFPWAESNHMHDIMEMMQCYTDSSCYTTTLQYHSEPLRLQVSKAFSCSSGGNINWNSQFNLSKPQGMVAFMTWFDELMQIAPAIDLRFPRTSEYKGSIDFTLGRTRGVEVSIHIEKKGDLFHITHIAGLCEVLDRLSDWEKECS